MQALDSSEAHINVCVYGDPGSGKTNLGVTAPSPLILLSERQGYLHIKQAAQRLGKPVPACVYMQTRQDYRDVYRALTGDRSKAFKIISDGKVVYDGTWPETVVFDSITDAGRIYADEIRRSMNLQKGKDGLEALPVSYWGALKNEFNALITSYRDIPMHTIFLALADRQKDAENKRNQLGPALPIRSLQQTLVAAVNICGYSYRALKEGRYYYACAFQAREDVMVKPYRPLKNIERPDFSAWLAAIAGDAVAPAADETDIPVSEEAT